MTEYGQRDIYEAIIYAVGQTEHTMVEGDNACALCRLYWVAANALGPDVTEEILANPEAPRLCNEPAIYSEEWKDRY